MSHPSRKLQSEIERTLKKIQEGNAMFDEIWERVHTAKNANLKEKYEKHWADLKKEIKRLQRYRDSVKTWASQDSIKDKRPLTEARKEIEVNMERFKRCERETKTKAYSKEALAAQSKADQLSQDQIDARDWVDGQVEQLESQLSELQEQQEKFQNGVSRKKKKNRDRDEEELTVVQKRIEQHELHVSKLNSIKEHIVKAHIRPSVVMMDLKENVEYYVAEAMQDPAFLDDEFLYEVVDEALQDKGREGGTHSSSAMPTEEEEVPDTTPAPVVEKKEKKTTRTKKSRKDKKKKSQSSSTPSSTKGQKASSQTSTLTTPAKTGSKDVLPTKADSSASGTKTLQHTPTSKSAAKPPTHPNSSSVLPSPMGAVIDDQTDEKATVFSSEPARSEAGMSVTSTNATFRTPPTVTSEIPLRDPLPSLSLTTQGNQAQPVKLADIIADELARNSQQQQSPRSVATAGQTPSRVGTAIPHSTQSGLQQPSQSSVTPLPTAVAAGSMTAGGVHAIRDPNHARQDRTGPFFGGEGAQPTKKQSEWMRGMHHSYQNMIQPMESMEKTYMPRNPYNTPSYFPEHPEPILDEPAIYEKFDTDTLFFIFYFQQGSYQQYLAATELKKGAWRYHKKYLTWFQRHAEPEETTEEYEKGTYVYFDYDTSWCPRMKSDFVFEYAYLEDELDI